MTLSPHSPYFDVPNNILGISSTLKLYNFLNIIYEIQVITVFFLTSHVL
jgi:hypothetical protein